MWKEPGTGECPVMLGRANPLTNSSPGQHKLSTELVSYIARLLGNGKGLKLKNVILMEVTLMKVTFNTEPRTLKPRIYSGRVAIPAAAEVIKYNRAIVLHRALRIRILIDG